MRRSSRRTPMSRRKYHLTSMGLGNRGVTMFPGRPRHRVECIAHRASETMPVNASAARALSPCSRDPMGLWT